MALAEDASDNKEAFDQFAVIRTVVANNLLNNRGPYPPNWLAQDYLDFLSTVKYLEKLWTTPGVSADSPSAREQQNAQRFLQSFWFKSEGRAFFINQRRSSWSWA